MRERLNRVSIQRRHRNPIDVTQPHAERTRDDVLWADGRRKDVGKDRASRPVTCHSMMSMAPRIPKIAPDAPTTGCMGVATSRPVDSSLRVVVMSQRMSCPLD